MAAHTSLTTLEMSDIITNKAKARQLQKKEVSAKKADRPKGPSVKKERGEEAGASAKEDAEDGLVTLKRSVEILSSLVLLEFILILGLGVACGIYYYNSKDLPKVPPVKKEVERGSSEVALNRLQGADVTAETSALLEEVREALALQEARNKLTALADQAISSGSRYAFRELERFYEDPENPTLQDACNAEIIRVESHYINVRRHRSYAIPMAKLFPGKKESDLTFEDLSQLLSEGTKHWEFRAWAAQQFGDIRGDSKVPDTLVRAMKGESDLCVVQEVLRSFEKVTGYRSLGVFDTKVAVSWWSENRDHFAKAGRNPNQ